MKFELEKDLIDIKEYYQAQLLIINRMPEKFYDIKNKNWNYQGGAMTKETKNKVIFNIKLRLKELENLNEN